MAPAAARIGRCRGDSRRSNFGWTYIHPDFYAYRERFAVKDNAFPLLGGYLTACLRG